MPAWLWPAVMAGSSLLGGLLNNRKQTQTQTTTPTMDPAYGGLQAMLMQQIQKRMLNPSKLPSGYEAGQIGNINNTYALAGQSLDNRMTARGLGTSPVAGAGETNLQLGRAGEISRMQAGLPLLEREMQNQDLASALQMLGLGRGTSSSATTPSNMLGGGVNDLATMLAFLYGSGAMGGQTSGAGQPVVNPAMRLFGR